MRTYRLIVLIALLTIVSGCYFGITGRVVDADTNQPIEGAVVLVEWTKTKGLPGMSYTESAKVAETLSDKDGKFNLPGCYDPLVNPPDVTVYKRGYVAWNNKYIFPDYKKRTDFKWGGYVFKLDKFEQTYSHADHYSFITSVAHTEMASDEKASLKQKINEWERIKAINERDEQRRKGRGEK